MTQPPNPPLIKLGEEVDELVRWLSNATGLSPSEVVSRIVSGQLHELWEYRAWLEQLSDTAKLADGKNLLISYGPESLLEGIRRLDPSYEFEHEKFIRQSAVGTPRRKK